MSRNITDIVSSKMKNDNARRVYAYILAVKLLKKMHQCSLSSVIYIVIAFWDVMLPSDNKNLFKCTSFPYICSAGSINRSYHVYTKEQSPYLCVYFDVNLYAHFSVKCYSDIFYFHQAVTRRTFQEIKYLALKKSCIKKILNPSSLTEMLHFILT